MDFGLELTRYEGNFRSGSWTPADLQKRTITHRIEITNTKQIDADVKKWLKTAYDLDD